MQAPHLRASHEDTNQSWSAMYRTLTRGVAAIVISLGPCSISGMRHGKSGTIGGWPGEIAIFDRSH
jgi:hypothetical protein